MEYLDKKGVQQLWAAVKERPGGSSSGVTMDQVNDAIEEALQNLPFGPLPDDLFRINADPQSEECGEVEGAGLAQKGMTVKLKATPYLTDNWMFTGWSEDGEIVSKANPYQFTVEKDRNLIAGFDNLYKFGRDWFITKLYASKNSSTTLSSMANLGSLIYNPHTETFFLGYGESIREIYTDVPNKLCAPSIASSGNKNITIDDDGNLWYINPSAMILRKYDIQTKTVSTICEKSALPETSTYTWNFAAYGNGVYVLFASNQVGNYAYSYDAKEWTVAAFDTATRTVTDLRYINGYFIAFTSTYLYSSRDGIKWKKTSLNGSLQDIAYIDDGKVLVVVSSYVYIVDLESGNVLDSFGGITTNSNPLRTCYYVDGNYIYCKNGGSTLTPTFYWETEFNSEDLVAVNPVPDLKFATAPTIMRSAYGNGMLLTLANDYNMVMYTTPSGPIDA